MEVQNKFLQVFSEIDTLNTRLCELGREAKMVLAQMLNGGVPLDSVTPFLAMARSAERHSGGGPARQGQEEM